MPYSSDELTRTRTTLLHRLKDWQDESSWQDFFDTYWRVIYSLAIKGGLTETEAQDVVQETMISIAKHMPGFKYDRRIGSFKAWLLNLTRWRIVDQLRKRKRLVALPEETATGRHALDKWAVSPSLHLDAVWEDEWEKNLLDAAVTKVKRRLDPQKYQMFDFYVNKGWTSDKVAGTFGVPVGQVYLAKHRVTEMIKEEVERLRIETI